MLQRVGVGKRTRVMSESVARDVVEAMTDVVRHGTGTRARQPFTVFGKTGTTNGSTDAWFTACIPDQKVCIATWMGYEYQSCTLYGPEPERAKLEVDGSCGGMKQLHGFKQVFGGTLPADAQVLQSFKGVGPKCAHLALGIACGQERISVDVHVHRVTNRWGYVEARSPEQTLAALEERLPRTYWVELNRLLVPFGKHVCTGTRPKCSTCPVLEMCQQVGVKNPR